MKVSSRTARTVLILTVFLLAVFLTADYLIWAKNYRGRAYPKTRIGDQELSGKTLAEIRNLTAEKIRKIESEGISFQYGGRTATLSTTVASFDSDLSYPAMSFDPEATALQAFDGKNNKNFWSYLLIRWGLKTPKQITAAYSLSDEKIKSFLEENFPDLNIESANAYFSLTADGKTGENELEIVPEKLGKEIDYESAREKMRGNLDNLKNEIIFLNTRSSYPVVSQADLSGLEKEIQKVADAGALTLRWQEPGARDTTTRYWTIRPEKLITWIGTEKNGARLSLILDQEKIKKYLEEAVSPEINQEAVQPRFEIKDGRVTSWQTGRDGREVDQEAVAQKISEAFFAGRKEIELATKSISAAESLSEDNFLIKEIIGTGHSNFTGSPNNRRLNIKNGASSLHGLLIKPNEEFSLIKALGEIDAESGYLPELVIKGDKTVPEFGGGLCQIGTTVFRTALASGLPITMRRNHSYRVAYYEPAGTDATIYDPLPDLRFVNDTGNYILIQSRLEKNDLYFDFWGIKDGRIATTTAPVIYNIVKPEPTKIIESEDLKPGEKKCTESSHNGADAYFDYKVIYPEGSTTTPVQERRFTSHYIPWQGVCLIGKTATTTSVNATSTIPSATSTPSVTPTQSATSTSSTAPAADAAATPPTSL